MNKIFTKEWLTAAGVRALKTIAQTALSMITLGVSFADVDWKIVVSVSLVSGVYSILTSIATGLPEVELPKNDK